MLSRTFSALSDPTRRKILEYLKMEEMSAGQIGQKFNITAPSISHHLNVLKQADLVYSRRQGQEIIYSLNLSVFEEISEQVMTFLKIRSKNSKL
ncbi:winged helix-turn-helix transcriptional regulator [Candidatus Falkowbacteria bacterium]|nr:winged helix-turn-helix transcriptional regulator [Candidatus Falkowbacteria bacterium]